MTEMQPISEKSEVKIRRATGGDLESLVAFAIQLFRQHQAYDRDRFQIAEPLAVRQREFFAEQINSEQTAFIVAESDEKIVGYAFLKIEEESFIDVRTATVWLHDIYLDEAARGRKIGERLLDAAKNAARDLGSDSLMLSVSPNNETAYKLFKDYGFRPTLTEMRLDF